MIINIILENPHFLGIQDDTAPFRSQQLLASGFLITSLSSSITFIIDLGSKYCKTFIWELRSGEKDDLQCSTLFVPLGGTSPEYPVSFVGILCDDNTAIQRENLFNLRANAFYIHCLQRTLWSDFPTHFWLRCQCLGTLSFDPRLDALSPSLTDPP